MDKKFYLTTAIAYVNAKPHLGFAWESILADVIARYRRERGERVYFLTGTDEHGTKIKRVAEFLGKDPQTLTDENAALVKDLKEVLNLSWDEFIRTTDQKRHWPNVNEVWEKLVAADAIYKKKYEGWYCVGHEAFVTEKDLVDGLCADHKTKPEKIEEENYFFRLSNYAEEIKNILEKDEIKIYPESAKREVLQFINEGLNDVSFSRPRKNLDWGIPVPGDDSQTIYVWCDALVNYLAPREFWPADLHVIGKDILKFHALYWPAMLLAAKLPLPKAIFVHGHITVGGEKMSKTLGNVVDPLELVKKYGVEAVRYYLLSDFSPFFDGDFTYEKFEARYNADLANGLGNLVARTSALIKKFGFEEVSVIELPEFTKLLSEKDLAMAEFRLNEALRMVIEATRVVDRYINEKEPWKTGDKKVIGEMKILVEEVAKALKPFLPETAEKVLSGSTDILFPRLVK